MDSVNLYNVECGPNNALHDSVHNLLVCSNKARNNTPNRLANLLVWKASPALGICCSAVGMCI